MATTETLATTTTTTITSSGYTAEDVIDAFVAQLDRMPSTVEAYRNNLRPFASWLNAEGVPIDRVTTAHIKAYKRHLMDNYKPTTTNAYLTACRRLFGWLEAEVNYPNPTKGIEGVRGTGRAVESKAHDALSHEQVKAVASFEGEGLVGKRNQALQNLMLTGALRCIEVSRLNAGDYRQSGDTHYLLIQGKGHATADTAVYVEPHTAKLIDAYLHERGKVRDNDPLFAGVGNRNQGGRMSTKTISRICKATMRECGIESNRLTAHSYRHTAITEQVKAGASLFEAQTYARHTDPKTTQIYIHANERMSGKCEGVMANIING